MRVSSGCCGDWGSRRNFVGYDRKAPPAELQPSNLWSLPLQLHIRHPLLDFVAQIETTSLMFPSTRVYWWLNLCPYKGHPGLPDHNEIFQTQSCNVMQRLCMGFMLSVPGLSKTTTSPCIGCRLATTLPQKIFDAPQCTDAFLGLDMEQCFSFEVWMFQSCLALPSDKTAAEKNQEEKRTCGFTHKWCAQKTGETGDFPIDSYELGWCS